MSRLTDLIQQTKAKDRQLGEDLEMELRALSSRRQFGLNFERHRPEAVELPQRTVRRGDKVRILPPRGSTAKGDPRLWRVASVTAGVAALHLTDANEPEMDARPLEDLVVVAEFRDIIYPGLVSTGSLARGGSKPFHTIINGENFHVLEALTYTHRGKIDAIYIDPPYNTGARDWKYNNNYVESDDYYRHSKWLAFMERRLLIAGELLNPTDSVLIVAIDEKEVHRLGLLLEQMFPDARIQMISVNINPAAVARNGFFGRADEYYYLVMFGSAGPRALPLERDWITARGRTHRGEIRWDLLRRSGSSPTREGHPDTFYPIFITSDGRRVHSIGDAIGPGTSRHSTVAPEGTFAVWPIRQDGTEGRWALGPQTAREVWAAGCLRLGGSGDGSAPPIYYLAEGERAKIAEGVYQVTGHRDDGSVITSSLGESARLTIPSSQWRVASHDSTQYGSRLLLKFLPGRKFPFPKSLYAIEDVLRFFIGDKPGAVVLDFFAGSGTTAHAVMRLNKQDGGCRQCILVTNNEVAADEQAALRLSGLRPGDLEWEQWGICEYITKPRVRAAISGLTPAGEPVRGDYRFADEFPMADGFDENAEFFTLTYENPLAVEHNRAFSRVAPLLWLRAGATGRRIDSVPNAGWDITDSYAVIFDLDRATEFADALREAPRIATAFIVTDDDRRFQSVARGLRSNVESVRLYESYLTNFQLSGSERV